MPHQLLTDLRRFRILVAAFLLLNIAAAVVERLHTSPQFTEVALGFLRLAQIIGIAVLAFRVFLADSAAHTRSQWWTRPISARSLLAAKLAFLALAVWLPMLVIYFVAWLTDGFTARQLALATAELTLYIAALSAIFAGAASVSTSIWAALARLAAIGIILGICAWIADAEGPNLEFWHLPTRLTPPVVLAGLTLAGILCLVAIFSFRKPALAYFGLAVVALIPIWMPAPSSDIETAAPADPELQKIKAVPPASDLAPAGSGAPIIAGNIALAGLPPGHFVVPTKGNFTFSTGGEIRAAFAFSGLDLGRATFHNLDLPTFAAPALRPHLPPGIRITNTNAGNYHFAIPQMARPSGDDSILTQPGQLEGNLTYFIFEADYAGVLTDRPGAEVRSGPYRLALLGARGQRESVRTSQPVLAFSSRPDDTASRGESWATWILAAHAPGSGEASLIRIAPYNPGGPFPITAQGRTSFDPNQFLPPGILSDDPDAASNSGIEYHAFLIRPLGTQTQHFAWDDHHVETDTQKMRSQILAGISGGTQTDGDAEATTTPVPDTIDEIKTLDQLAATSAAGRNLPGSQLKKLQSISQELFSKDIPGSLSRAPWPSPIHNHLESVLAKNLTPDHLPALRQALARDPRLITAAEKAGLGPQLREYVTAQLNRRNPNTEPATLRIAAAFQDPALYPDLRWHFIHAPDDPEKLYPLLAAMPGFDAPSTLAEAWHRATLTNTQYNLWPLALRHGLPGALDYGIRQLYEAGTIETLQKSHPAAPLIQATAFEAPLKDFYPWIQKNSPTLTFNPKTKLYQ